jgi:hypothetical protein
LNDPAGYCTTVTGPPVNECDGVHQLNACDALDAPATQLGTATDSPPVICFHCDAVE